jgi:hypothetical protein
MTTSLYYQRLTDQRDRMLHGNAQPELVIFTHRKRFIEPAKPGKQVLRHHHRRRTHQTKLQAAQKYIARRFLVFCLRIDFDAIAKPNFFGLGNLNFRVALHEGGLNFELLGPPKIIGIEKSNVAPSARLTPKLRAAATPPLALVKNRSWQPNFPNSFWVSSVEPSSTTMSSKSAYLCAQTDSTASPTMGQRLKVGMTTLTRGGTMLLARSKIRDKSSAGIDYIYFSQH